MWYLVPIMKGTKTEFRGQISRVCAKIFLGAVFKQCISCGLDHLLWGNGCNLEKSLSQFCTGFYEIFHVLLRFKWFYGVSFAGFIGFLQYLKKNIWNKFVETVIRKVWTFFIFQELITANRYCIGCSTTLVFLHLKIAWRSRARKAKGGEPCNMQAVCFDEDEYGLVLILAHYLRIE